jgi:hypothetical protein
MTVAPVPVLRLLLFACLREFVSAPGIVRTIPPVGPVFFVIPVMVVLVVPIVDSDLNASVLRFGHCHDCCRRSKGSSQEERTDVAMCVMHGDPPSPDPRLRSRGRSDCALRSSQLMSPSAHVSDQAHFIEFVHKRFTRGRALPTVLGRPL